MWGLVLTYLQASQEQKGYPYEISRPPRKTHKQFMLLHGTRWDYAPLILENGLDPSCGHLTKGTWLGGIAEKAHSYAAKGPGPEIDSEGNASPGSGKCLFTLFVVAAVPDISDGDDERSFGVPGNPVANSFGLRCFINLATLGIVASCF